MQKTSIPTARGGAAITISAARAARKVICKVTHRQIKIPSRAYIELAISIFVEIRAESKRIDVMHELAMEIPIDKAGNIYIGRIARGWVGKGAGKQSSLSLIEVISNIGYLCAAWSFWRVNLYCQTACCTDEFRISVIAINFKQITATQLGQLIIRSAAAQRSDIDALRACAHMLHQIVSP